jgi:nitroimidazol reductase NimA-like FMN-containing flavoprotein (pyridoxamine 5'-phosphate oxidase superfamily)
MWIATHAPASRSTSRGLSLRATECDTSVAYRSVVAFGRIRIVEERAQKQRFFEAFMDEYRDPRWERARYSFPRLDQVTVYAIAIERMTGKQTPLPAPEAQWSAKGGAPSST